MAENNWTRYKPTKELMQDNSSNIVTDWRSVKPTPDLMRDEISPVVSGIRKGVQGASAGFLDEASGLVEAGGRAVGIKGLGGSFGDVEIDDRGPTFSKKDLIEAYELGRDRKREYLKQDEIDNPGVSGASELVGAVVSPVNKILPNASLLKSGAAIGGITGLGNSEAEDVSGMVKDLATGAVIGAGAGKVLEKATPLVGAATKYVGTKIDPIKKAIGEKAKEFAEAAAFKATGATLKDFRAGGKKGTVSKVGRYLLDKGIVGFGDDVDDVAKKALEDNARAGNALDEIYTKAESQFKEQLQKVGFDPKRDKQEILDAAKKELGDTEGAGAALQRLSNYLDDVAKNFGDAPNEAAQKAYQQQVKEYLPKQKQYLKDKKQYKNELGKAGEDLDQQVLPNTYDDLQRTGSETTKVETIGINPSKMTPEQFEKSVQLELQALPENVDPAFTGVRGKGFERAQEKINLDKNSDELFFKNSKQSKIEGVETVPRFYKEAPRTVIDSGTGQLKFSIAPNAPARPIKPAEVRNPMSPRRANDIKGALDEKINYSRNPLNPDPASEKAFYGARTKLLEKVEQGLDDLGGGEVVEALKKANREYGFSKQASNMAKDRMNREMANKWGFGLTDTIAAGAGTAYGAITGDWQTALVGMAGKKVIEKYGVSTLATVSNKIAQRLLRSPAMKKVATEKPAVFGAMVYDLVQRMEQRTGSLPRAAESESKDFSSNSEPKKGESKWAQDGAQKIMTSTGDIPKYVLESMMSDKKGRQLLIEASELKPGSSKMENLIKKIRTGYLQKGDQ